MFVVVEDEHGNRREYVALQRHNAGGLILADAPANRATVDAVRDTAKLSGMMAASGEIPMAAVDTANFVGHVGNNAGEYARKVQNLRPADISRAAGRAPQVLKQMPEAVVRQYWRRQDVNNPYDADTSELLELVTSNQDIGDLSDEERLYLAYARGYIEGYAGFSGLTAYASGGGTQLSTVIRNSDRVADTAERIDDLSGGRVSSAYRYYRKLRNPRIETARSVGRRLASSVDGLDSSVARRVLGQAETVGSAVKLRQRLDRLPTESVRRLSPDEQSRIGRLLTRADEEGMSYLSRSSAPMDTLADGGRRIDARFRRSVLQAANSDQFDSFREIDEAVRHIDSLSGPENRAARGFVAASDDAGLKAVLRFKQNSNVDLGNFARRIDRFSESDKREIARMITQADDGAELGAGLSNYHLRQIANSNNGKVAARLHNRNVDVTNIQRLIDDGIDLNRVETLLSDSYSGFSTGGKGFSGHYSDHAGEWSPRLTRQQYRTTAEELMNQRRNNIEIYYQKSNDNLAIYDPSANELAIGGGQNAKGRIQTLFRPRPNYVSDRAGNDWIRLK